MKGTVPLLVPVTARECVHQLLSDPPHLPPTIRLENSIDEDKGHILMEKVTHAVYEDHRRLFPLHWLCKPILMAGHILKAPMAVKALVHPFCIAIFTALGNFGASGYGVPGFIGPFNFRHDQGFCD
jgi:hypothetical protein